ncbi:hypothetical protein ATEIFO6365_0011001100 [Aspergillus terreus]|uniref:Uncharacterized protein n=1 Tax=Aspergillus terreus TaxID=33178 RepID=A0A5M3Z1Z3_ASPTE|nr:hypothetical protein ATETN484_0006001100 [Aspergillus terreus]GFF19752.1 hypothetical protein ATEIFO6365_0011001100 [Aspergillus terreus]
MFRIAIIGGGLGGLFAALAVKHHCPTQPIEIDIFEQAAQYSEIGAGVGIGPNAAALIEKLGLMKEAFEIAGKRENIWLSFLRYDTGAGIATIKMPQAGNKMQLPMHRAEFLDLLVRAIQRRGAATLHTNMRSNLVIGADGIHSVVRSHYVQDDARYGDMIVYRGLCPIADIEQVWPHPTYATLSVAPGKHFLTFPISNNKTLNVVGFVTTPWEKIDKGTAKESWTLVGDKDDIRHEYKDFSPAVRTVIEKMDANPLKWILFDRQTPSKWVYSGGKAVLLGDAAHAMCPHQGAGAGQALEDGYILGRALRDYFGNAEHRGTSCSIYDALSLYNSIRYPRSEKVQTTSRQAGDLYQLKAPELAGLNYDDALPVMERLLKNRMQWIWTEDIDVVYEAARESFSRL